MVVRRFISGPLIEVVAAPASAVEPYVPSVSDYVLGGLAYNVDAGEAYLVTGGPTYSGGTLVGVGVCAIAFADLPKTLGSGGSSTLDAADVTFLTSRALGQVKTGKAPGSDLYCRGLAAFRLGGSDRIYGFIRHGSSALQIFALSAAGVQVGLVEPSYPDPAASIGYQGFAASGDELFVLEPSMNPAYQQRITRRDPGTLSEQAELEFDNTFTTFDGFSCNGGADIVGILPAAGGVRVYMYPDPVSGSNDYIYYRDIASAPGGLSWSGSWVRVSTLGLTSAFRAQNVLLRDVMRDNAAGSTRYFVGLKIPGGSGATDWFSISGTTVNYIAADIFGPTAAPRFLWPTADGNFVCLDQTEFFGIGPSWNEWKCVLIDAATGAVSYE